MQIYCSSEECQNRTKTTFFQPESSGRQEQTASGDKRRQKREQQSYKPTVNRQTAEGVKHDEDEKWRPPQENADIIDASLDGFLMITGQAQVKVKRIQYSICYL